MNNYNKVNVELDINDMSNLKKTIFIRRIIEICNSKKTMNTPPHESKRGFLKRVVCYAANI